MTTAAYSFSPTNHGQFVNHNHAANRADDHRYDAATRRDALRGFAFDIDYGMFPEDEAAALHEKAAAILAAYEDYIAVATAIEAAHRAAHAL